MTRESLFQFLRTTVTNPSNGASMDVLIVLDGNHIRPCSSVEERLYGALEGIADRETEGVELGNGWDAFRRVVMEAREAIGA